MLHLRWKWSVVVVKGEHRHLTTVMYESREIAQSWVDGANLYLANPLGTRYYVVELDPKNPNQPRSWKEQEP